MDNKEDLTLRIEKAKAWFVLAQITIILAGFFFATSGILLTNAQNTMNFGLDVAERAASKNCGLINNVSNYQYLVNETLVYAGDLVYHNLSAWKDSAYAGLGCIFLSILFWVNGFYRLKN